MTINQAKGRALNENDALAQAHAAFPGGWEELSMFATPDGMVEWTATAKEEIEPPPAPLSDKRLDGLWAEMAGAFKEAYRLGYASKIEEMEEALRRRDATEEFKDELPLHQEFPKVAKETESERIACTIDLDHCEKQCEDAIDRGCLSGGPLLAIRWLRRRFQEQGKWRQIAVRFALEGDKDEGSCLVCHQRWGPDEDKESSHECHTLSCPLEGIGVP